MQTYFRHAAVALALAAGTQAAGAQTWITREPVVETQTVIAGQPLQLTPAQRTTIYRTIVPQGRGRGPIVRERIVTEPVAPAPIVRERIVTQPVENDYAYDYTYVAPPVRQRIVTPPASVYQDYAYAVGSRVPARVRLAPIPQSVVAEVPVVRPYRYMLFNNRLLLIDPVTSTVVADVTE